MEAQKQGEEEEYGVGAARNMQNGGRGKQVGGEREGKERNTGNKFMTRSYSALARGTIIRSRSLGVCFPAISRGS